MRIYSGAVRHPPDPERDDALNRANGQGIRGTTNKINEQADSDAIGTIAQSAQAHPMSHNTLTKCEANVIAPAALAGIAVTPIEDDRGRRVYLVSKWSMTRQCDSLDEVRKFLARLGVAS